MAIYMRQIHVMLICIFLLAVSLWGCGGHSDNAGDITELKSLLTDCEYNPYDQKLDSAPDENCVKLQVKHIGPLRKAFLDSNYKHLESAKVFGTKLLSTIADAWCIDYPLVKIRSCREYYVDHLTHSLPYLVPEAAELLGEIGRRFNDTLEARGGGNYRLKVTSVLRTPATVRRLRRVNRNATDSSAHQFATTFDISYSKFICDSLGVNRSFEDLKNLLGEILYELRDEKRCYVVFERKQSCFHITVRP